MNYKYKRTKAGLSLYTVAKEIGLSKKKYLEVEKKNLHLEGNHLDKFMKTLENAKEINFNRMVKMRKVDEWLDSGAAMEDLKTMNHTQQILADALGVTYSYVNHVLKDHKRYGVPDDIKEEIYDFLHDCTNKHLEDKKPITSNKVDDTDDIFSIIDKAIQEKDNTCEVEICEEIEPIKEDHIELVEPLEEEPIENVETINEDTISTCNENQDLLDAIHKLEAENTYLKDSLRRLFNL